MNEQGKGTSTWKITKYLTPESYEQKLPDEVTEIHGNVFLDEGINELLLLACNLGGTAFGTATSQLGVGTSDTAAVATQTALQDASAEYKDMDLGYPTVAGGTATFKSTFGTGDANYAWNEFSARNDSTADINWNRKVSAQGTKVVGATWELTLEISIS